MLLDVNNKNQSPFSKLMRLMWESYLAPQQQGLSVSDLDCALVLIKSLLKD